MLRALNWSGILFGVGAGFIVGSLLTLLTFATGGGTFGLVVAQLLSFAVAGYVAGRFSLVGELLAGGFAGLLLYFVPAAIAVAAGSDVEPVAILLFGIAALVIGTLGAVFALSRRS